MNEFTTGPISGRQILHVSAEGEFTWHPDAGTLIETCDFSNSPAMQHILRKLWDYEKAYQLGRDSMKADAMKQCERLAKLWPDEGGDARGCAIEIEELK